MWPGFDGKIYSREQWLQHVAQSTIFPGCNGVVQHATGIPTLAQALTMNEANYARNTQIYYENSLGWAHGPHVFATPYDIIGFSALDCRGTHDSCENYAKLGIEGMGNRNTEDFSVGPGAAMLENQHFAMACLFLKLKLVPNPSTYVPHSACQRDGHFQCPHENWEKLFRVSETAAIIEWMHKIGEVPYVPTGDIAISAKPIYPPDTPPLVGSIAWCQTALNKAGASPQLTVDGDNGPATKAAIWAFQARTHIEQDGQIGPQTIAMLRFSADAGAGMASVIAGLVN